MNLIDKIRSFKQCHKGLAFLEFSLVFPLMMVTFLGIIEVVAFYQARGGVDNIAAVTGDLITRLQVIDSTEMDNVWAAVNAMSNGSSTSFDLDVVSVKKETDGSLSVDWSRSYATNGESSSALKTSVLADVDPDLIPTDNAVLVSQYVYHYAPVFGNFLGLTAFDITGRFLHAPRLSNTVAWCVNGVNSEGTDCL